MEFNCEGCAASVWIAVGRVPAHGFCAICQWCSDFIPPEQVMQTRRRVEPGGWISERVVRAGWRALANLRVLPQPRGQSRCRP